MMDNFLCDICGAPMIFVEKMSNHITRYKTQCKRRRFACTLCEYEKVIHGDGEFDEIHIPNQGIDAVKKIFKQEEINRLGRPL